MNQQPVRVQKGPLLLSEEQFLNISKELDELLRKTKAQLLLFADMDGQLICQKGEFQNVDTAVLAALIAGDFSATSEIAKMIGEKGQFRLHFHEGRRYNLYISSVAEDFFLAVIFDPSVTLGMVRIFTHRTIQKLAEIIRVSTAEMAKVSQLIDSEFRSSLEEELDRILR